jgi:putative salt-induced outer membrane protein YdiY
MQRDTMRFHVLRLPRSLAVLPAFVTTSLLASSAFAQAVTVDTTTAGAPPADQKALVAAPTTAVVAPDIDLKANDSQSATVSAGGQLSTGNSKLVAGTGNAIYAIRRGQNAFGASIIGNYGESAVRPNNAVLTTENLQGKLRYDRFLTDRLSVFGLVTGRHDYFQGLDFRLNLDPGAKYIFVKTAETAFWGEAGYDFQQDVRNNTARHIPAVVDATTGAVTTPAYSLERYHPDHSTRLFAGWHHDFNEHVNFTTGLEYLQSLEASYRNRLNYDILLAAGVGAGFSVGVGFSLRYDHSPIPGKTDLDTITTFSLIYAFSDKKAAAPAQLATCPCTEVNPSAPPSSGTPPPPADGPAPAAPATPPAAAPSNAPDSTNTTTVKPQSE